MYNQLFDEEFLSLPFSDEVEAIITSAIRAVDPELAVKKHIIYDGAQTLFADGQCYDLSNIENIYIIGVGKGVQPMVKALLDIFPGRINSGVIITKHLNESNNFSDDIRILVGNHPVPDRSSVESARELVDFTSRFSKNDLVFCVITGGGSSLMCLPRKGIIIEDIQDLTKQLLASGATINEMNVLRKHLDQVKGGGLAQFVYPAKMISLILSDVISNPLDVIASGPTAADISTYDHCISILRKYKLWESVPKSIRFVLQAGSAGEISETIRPGDKCLQNIQNIIIGDNFLGCQRALEKSKSLGYNSLLLTTFLQGEAREAGKVMASVLRQIDSTSQPIARPACIIAGGETTVHILGNGKGGRNQELALGAVYELAGLEKVALITFATDGEDGPTDAAGAIVTGHTLQRGFSSGLDPIKSLQNNDSYHYFEGIEGLVKTGPTGTNVNDMIFLFAFV